MDYNFKADPNLINVIGGSMFPTLRHGDKILAKEVKACGIKVRDIIIYENKFNYPVTHRVIKIVNSGEGLVFYAKGDFSAMVDAIHENKVLGKVMLKARGDKFKFLSFEKSAIYCFFVNILCSVKDSFRKIIEKAYSSPFLRKSIKRLFPLQVSYEYIQDVRQSLESKSCYNVYPFIPEGFFPFCEFIAKYKTIAVGKLVVLKNKNGEYRLFGPFVRLFYRARGIGTGLIKKGQRFLQKEPIHPSF